VKRLSHCFDIIEHITKYLHAHLLDLRSNVLGKQSQYTDICYLSYSDNSRGKYYYMARFSKVEREWSIQLILIFSQMSNGSLLQKFSHTYGILQNNETSSSETLTYSGQYQKR